MIYTVRMAVLLLLAGCATTIAEGSAAPDWPRLKVVRHVVSGIEVIKRCYKYVPTGTKLIGGVPQACAEVNFYRMRCDIWLTDDSSPDVIEHEELHCLGFEHPGEKTLTKAWIAFKERK